MNILIADDHAVVRQGTVALLSAMVKPTQVWEAGNGEQACKLCSEHQPELVIMDINLPGISGIEAVRRILQRSPQTRILMFSMYSETALVKQALDVGALGYVTKNSPPDLLIEAVKRVGQGHMYVEHELAMKLMTFRSEQAAHPFQDMTQREFEVFLMLARGLKVSTIAERLCISNKTVSNYTANLKSKLGIGSTAELVHLAIESGVVKVGG
ncbi:response regulator transcription factor [Neptunomonas phycophila]|jgi:DNA-binding NarL/FixJ family response regulator|uniref:Response regulator transcription factor n=1 Tax=Neptunomonas phycophila TaxID=1572645 RepID=A0AAW7XGS5_9GAMM|nr:MULTISPECIES: response regulator transcription factor [Neptunomonas]MBT3145275.1 response regulator transcription factor [Neptunomonas phycophila]MDN2659178.1 response regulator transcription factor [Neptunomonas sp. CHC150]MDO6453523.1 response regulator transcription factor [Neptunomonas phycophila]MDO6468325.1 response regulator transcription factor [Neptunomonas phycophila]MDO6784772.1 response regulator transcription factor [Neptunomonas phycophila]